MDTLQSHFRRRVLLVAGLGIVLLAVYVWAILTAELSLLNMLGFASFLILLICPVFVAIQTVRITLYMDASVPIRTAIQASLSRSASLLLLAALVAVPICVFFGLYLQIAIAGIFNGIDTCEGTYCPPKPPILLDAFIPQTILVLLVVIGIWGLNLLAAILGASLAQRWRKAMPAISGTILALVVTVAIMYSLLNLTTLPQVPVDLVAAVLPYLFTWGAWHRFSVSAPSVISPSKP